MKYLLNDGIRFGTREIYQRIASPAILWAVFVAFFVVLCRSVKNFEVVDVENLDADRPEAAVRRFEIKGKPSRLKCDLAIVGGGTGGVAAAIAACAAGLDVCLIEETSWLGGQMTAQGVSALDENYLVESTGATRTYHHFRNEIRNHYRALGGKDGGARFEPQIDPGNCWVSRLAFEPKVAVKVISKMLQPYLEKGKLRIFLRSVAVELKIQGQKIRTIRCVELDSAKFFDLSCRFCIDATELGDLLPLAGMKYRSGVEAHSETREAHAPENANPENVQDFTYPFVVEFRKGEQHKIPKPPQYDRFNEAGKFSFQSYRMFENSSKISASGESVELLPFWEYRRLIFSGNFPESIFPNDISMINWDSNDLRSENIIDQDLRLKARRLALGKHLSLGFLYWLQNEVERDDGGKGYPELKLRPDVLGTGDGLSKYPYIRESRRIVPLKTIVESDVAAKDNPGARAKWCPDSIGIGLYPIDIHGEQDIPGAGQASKPFQIPAGALVQKQIRNLLPAAKNIGVTHISNGAYRLHPIEWAIGEATGFMAAEVLRTKTDILRCYRNKNSLRRIQKMLLDFGSPLVWFDDLKPDDVDFAAAQFVSLVGLMPVDQGNLQFRPDDFVRGKEFEIALSKVFGARGASPGSPEAADNGAVSLTQLAELNTIPIIKRRSPLKITVKAGETNLTRRQFASWLLSVFK